MKICPLVQFLLTISTSIWLSSSSLVKDSKELTDSVEQQTGVYLIVYGRTQKRGLF